MNYVNRVKGQRIGKSIHAGRSLLQQGSSAGDGNLIDVPIVVPPEPGLMGAFGVALEVSQNGNETEKVFQSSGAFHP